MPFFWITAVPSPESEDIWILFNGCKLIQTQVFKSGEMPRSPFKLLFPLSLTGSHTVLCNLLSSAYRSPVSGQCILVTNHCGCNYSFNSFRVLKIVGCLLPFLEKDKPWAAGSRKLQAGCYSRNSLYCVFSGTSRICSFEKWGWALTQVYRFRRAVLRSCSQILSGFIANPVVQSSQPEQQPFKLFS